MILTNRGFAVIQGDTHASQHVIDTGTLLYEPENIQRIQGWLKPGDVCVDAGACIGAFSRGMKDKVGDQGIVYSFEPNPAAFECLQHNCPDCIAFNYGLAGSTQERVMHPETNAGATWFTMIEGNERATTQFQPLDRMDLTRLDFFKIDVEGMEFHVLLGAKETLIRCRPIVWIEINHLALARQQCTYLDILKPMNDLGYTRSIVPAHAGMSLRAGEWAQVDLCFMP